MFYCINWFIVHPTELLSNGNGFTNVNREKVVFVDALCLRPQAVAVVNTLFLQNMLIIIIDSLV